MKTAGELCTRTVVTIGKDEHVREAARRMRDRHIGSLIVVEGERPIGILTDRDLTVTILANPLIDADQASVVDAMSQEPVTVQARDSLFDAFRLMRTYGVRRLPVVDDEGTLVGILSFDDVLEQLADALGDMATLIARGRQIEQAQR